MSDKRWQYYHTVWAMLFLAWMVSYIDRALLTPVITWMIDNRVGFLANVQYPYSLGGLVGGLFFAGYMLLQFPAGYTGDRHGHKTVVVISIMWAALTTLLTGLVSGLFLFVAMRVLTGVGEGAFYSNDRSLIAAATPPSRRGLGMGIVISGLTIGLTIAMVSGSYTVEWATGIWGYEHAWRVPFIIWSAPTAVVGLLIVHLIRHVPPKQYEKLSRINPSYVGGFWSLARFSGLFFIIIMAVFYVTMKYNLSLIATAIALTILALCSVGYVFFKRDQAVRRILVDRNLFLLYVSAIAILWTLWFYGYWAIAIIKEAAGTSLTQAALQATFFALAGLIGFPVGGWLSDLMQARGKGRKGVLLLLTACNTIFIIGLASYLMAGGTSSTVMGLLLFGFGLFFFAVQPVSHALTADLAPVELRASAFGMWNLIAEIGAVLSPVVSGAIKDVTGKWDWAILLDGLLVAASLVLIAMIRERR